VRDQHSAQDLVQDGLSAIHRKRHTFSGRGSFRGWVFQLMRNLCLNHLRRHKPHLSLDALHEDRGLEQVGSEPQPDEQTLRAEQRRLLWQAIDGLPERSREVLMLREFDGLRYREIAQVLEIPIGTVMSRLHDGRERLRRELEGIL